MEIIRLQDAHRFEASDTSVAYEYATKDPALNIARVEINGRFPKNGSMRNNVVKEIVFVESGSGQVTIDRVTHEIKKGDVILYEKGELVSWEGSFSLTIACTPAWTPAQHEIVPLQE